MDNPKIRQQIMGLAKERNRLERQLMTCRMPMEEGSLVETYTACRKGNCKCTRGEKHGPFLYLNQRVDGKRRLRYVGKKSDQATVRRVRAYMAYQDELAELRKVNKEIDDLFNSYREKLTRS
jgi:hypothetical protein